MSLCIILNRWVGFMTPIFRNVEGWRGLEGSWRNAHMSNLISSIVLPTSVSIARYHMFINFSMVCLKVLHLVISSSSHTLRFLAQSFQIYQQIITSIMQVTVTFSFHFQLLLILIILLFQKLRFQVFLTGGQQIFSLSLVPKLTEFFVVGFPQQLSKLTISYCSSTKQCHSH